MKNTRIISRILKPLTLAAALFVMGVQTTQAQDYKTGIGVRGGLSNGLTIKHFIKSEAALEFILANRWRGYNATVLYELHKELAPQLNLYYGIGGHIGRWHGYDKHPWFNDDKIYTVIGVDAIIGLEYTFKEIPFNVGIDYKPGFNLVGYSGYWGDEGALSIRFVF